MIRRFLAAVSFLSILPVGRFQPTEAELKGSLAFFPWAGMLFGLIGWGVAWCLVQVTPPLPAAMLLALLPEALTKGFHLDGLADTADGFLSSRPRERKLEIMRDSHTGAMGVAAIFALLGLKFAFLASLPAAWLPWAAGLMLLWGRCGMTLYIGFSRSARPDGLGKLWLENFSLPALLSALLLIAATAWLPGWRGLAALAVYPAGAWLWSRISRKVIGGATGDTIGCCEEFSELAALIVCAAAVAPV